VHVDRFGAPRQKGIRDGEPSAGRGFETGAEPHELTFVTSKKNVSVVPSVYANVALT